MAPNTMISKDSQQIWVSGLQPQHQVTLHRQHPTQGLTTLNPEQKELFDIINLPTPILRVL